MILTPTPGPNTQFVERLGNTLDSAVQQGVVGVLLLLSVAAALLSLGFALYMFRNRNAKPKESAENLLAPMASLLDRALSGITEAGKKLDDQETRHKLERREVDDEHRKELKDLAERGIANEEKMTTALTALSGLQAPLVADIGTIKTVVETINTLGSIPLQRVSETVTRIETKLDNAWKANDSDQRVKENILKELSLVNQELTRVNEAIVRIESKRRSTDELNKVSQESKHEPVPT